MLRKHEEWFSIAPSPIYPQHFYFSGNPVTATALLERITPTRVLMREPVAEKDKPVVKQEATVLAVIESKLNSESIERIHNKIAADKKDVDGLKPIRAWKYFLNKASETPDDCEDIRELTGTYYAVLAAAYALECKLTELLEKGNKK